MTNDETRTTRLPLASLLTALVIGLAACTVPNPNYRKPGSDAGVDAAVDGPACSGNQALRCEGTMLVSCNGTSEVKDLCLLGCDTAGVRCFDVAPSNGLASFLDMAASQPDLSLGDTASIDTNTGEVKVNGSVVPVKNELLTQSGGPKIRLFIVRSLVAKGVTVTGTNALGIVSSNDLKVLAGGVFTLSGGDFYVGPGAFADGGCTGGAPPPVDGVGEIAGFGGGGFGTAGGAGGSGTSSSGSQQGGAGGAATGNAALVPLRGGCGTGGYPPAPGNGGGAIQLVSLSKIVIEGVIAANGSNTYRGGGSGGGILLEAPVVQITGSVVANGAGGGGGEAGEDGRFDSQQAQGGLATTGGNYGHASGGLGAAGSSNATAGADGTSGFGTVTNFGGSGGGGAGRIRVNTASGTVSVSGAGLFSPSPSLGTLATR